MNNPKLNILAFGAHPDDVELGCAGTLIKETQKGQKVGIIDLTLGELGTRGNAKIRKDEAQKAAKIMGIALRENMGFKDGLFQNNEENKIAIIEKIRNYQPDIVIACAHADRHPDHPKCSQLITEACFLSGLEKIDTKQAVWRPKAIYYYIQFQSLIPNLVIDISAQMLLKLKAIKSYSSQFYNPESKESPTIISSKNFLDSISYRAKDLGRQSNCKYAEGFVVHHLLKVDSLTDLK